jgi:dipeptidase E
VTVLLGGGGGPDDERPVLDRFIELVGHGEVAYWPIALAPERYEDATAYATSALRRPVSTWAQLREHTPDEVAALAGVFIGGGNTFQLLNEVRLAGLADAVGYLAANGVVYGGSAGAILLGADIGTASVFDRNDVGLTDTRGLGLIGEHDVWCHFVDSHRDHIRQRAHAVDRPVLALTERSGAEVADDRLQAIGHEPALVFERGSEPRELRPGESIALAW